MQEYSIGEHGQEACRSSHDESVEDPSAARLDDPAHASSRSDPEPRALRASEEFEVSDRLADRSAHDDERRADESEENEESGQIAPHSARSQSPAAVENWARTKPICPDGMAATPPELF